ncbi:MAG: porphobilinogen synthase [Phycisphaerales bacterium]|nr:porphobilinogen synthase [Phycisphaerales bacterium]
MTTRLHRLRATPALRDLVREHRLHPHHFIQPLFVTDDPSLAGEIPELPGVRRWLVEDVAAQVQRIAAVGVRGVLLFGVPQFKDASGSQAWAQDGPVCRAIRDLEPMSRDIAVIADVCLCQYTEHGHCGLLDESGRILNDQTLEVLGAASVAYAAAGASLVAPSGMMDGAVNAIRSALDDAAFEHVGILSYAVKHASALYAPFRGAARSAPVHGDRRTHQLDPANARQALREAELDFQEGADILMVKPALTNLDTLVRLRQRHPTAMLAAYEVSGEYIMLHSAAQRGLLDERSASLELLTAIKRAGADVIVTYRACQAAQWLAEDASC